MSTNKYFERMKNEARTQYPCVNCLRDTEDMIRKRDFQGVSAGDRLWYETYVAETDEFVRALTEYTPQGILDVGSGFGRVIDLISTTLPQAKVTGTEIDRDIHRLLTARFQGNPNIKIELADVIKYLGASKQQFDMVTCLMNTYGNINDESFFTEILRHSKYFLFTLYNPKHDEKRADMYAARCHLDFSFDGHQYNFTDPWSKVTISRSYSKEDIKALVRSAGADLLKLKEVGILHFCVAKKKD